MKATARRVRPRRRHAVLQRALWRSETASSLSAVLVLIMLVTTLTGLILMARQVRERFVQRGADRLQAYYAAESGLHRALARLHRRPGWRPEGEQVRCRPAPPNAKTPGAEAAQRPSPRSGAQPRRRGQQQRGQQGNACRVSARPFGGHLRLESEASVGSATRRVAALVGRRPSVLFESAIALEDTKADFVLAGAAVVRGAITMGRGEVRTERLGRAPFTGEHAGSVRTAGPGFSLPSFDASLPRATIQALQPYLTGQPPGGALTLEEARRRVRHAARAQGARPSQSGGGGSRSPPRRAGGRLVIVARGDLTLTPADSAVVRRARVVAARGTLSVQGPLRFAPQARLAAGQVLKVHGAQLPYGVAYGEEKVDFSGRARGKGVQVLAGRRAIVRGQARLGYPSFVYARGEAPAGKPSERQGSDQQQQQREPAGIALEGQASVEGTLLYQPDGPPEASGEGAPGEEARGGRRRAGRVVVAEGARARGAVYSAAFTELHGRVAGTVLTREFYFYRSPTRYINWLAGGSVDVGARPAGFLVPYGLGREAPAPLRLPSTSSRPSASSAPASFPTESL